MNLKDKLLLEEQKSFIGWDFSYLEGRVTEEPLNWDYKKIIKSYLKKTDKLLDMGTGGGEFLLTLNHPFHLTCVTEGYLPNLKLCKERLAPLGITVKHIFKDKEIPYENQMFDIVINKHESYDLDEVYRILKPNGYFITQQVGGLNNVGLSDKLGCIRTIDENHNLKYILKNLDHSKFNVLFYDEAFPKTKFLDLGALVYYAKILPWEFPNFSVENNFDEIKNLEADLMNKKYIETIEHRFILVLQKI